jgi:hypothetical protein
MKSFYFIPIKSNKYVEKLICLIVPLVVIISCNSKNQKPKLLNRSQIEKVDNELIDDRSTSDLITIVYQKPDYLWDMSYHEAFNWDSPFLKRRSKNWTINKEPYGNWKGYFNRDTTMQILTKLNHPNINGTSFMDFNPRIRSHYLNLIVNKIYNDELLLKKEIKDYTLLDFKGLVVKSKWLINETKDTLFNTMIILYIEDYQFLTTIDLINFTEAESTEITDNFVKSLWVKIEKDGRGYGN